MIGIVVKVFNVPECDRCGVKLDVLLESTNEAKAAAIASGWIVSEWLFE